MEEFVKIHLESLLLKNENSLFLLVGLMSSPGEILLVSLELIENHLALFTTGQDVTDLLKIKLRIYHYPKFKTPFSYYKTRSTSYLPTLTVLMQISKKLLQKTKSDAETNLSHKRIKLTNQFLLPSIFIIHNSKRSI